MSEKNEIIAARARHHRGLESLAASINPNNTTPGGAIWRKLARIEREAHAAATAQCNGAEYGGQPFRPDWDPTTGEECENSDWDTYRRGVLARVTRVFGGTPPGLFLNSDARGYALKLKPKADNTPATPFDLVRDCGRNQILVPTID